MSQWPKDAQEEVTVLGRPDAYIAGFREDFVESEKNKIKHIIKDEGLVSPII